MAFIAATALSVTLMSQKKTKFRDQVGGDDVYNVPLPDAVVKMLRAARLCTLATSTQAGPHLSLMNFTYYRPDEVIIFCTRRNTKKYDQIRANREVAVLINDFPLLRNDNGIPSDDKNTEGSTCTGSITLNGTAQVLEDSDPQGQLYRREHLTQNKEYAHFITGEDIAVIAVRFDSARMCNFKDQVKHWER